ncbi:hypothetical protein OHA37_29650 [Streptomyces sp. NBC_00335]|uniref:hypothetical protein n=1 Tax=unclassified Streptomyces TaxID=2593676 RepID=UPI002253EDBF|nr:MULTISPECIES: hypothetical protein [unclassified Streptomyces]MCX5408017.1 hypothetical protein [Streptomyces sp. NBC_00086]
MRGHGNEVPGPRRLRAQAALAALALCGTLALTACNGNEEAGAPGTPASPATSAAATGTASPSASPSPSSASSATPKKPAPTATSTATPEGTKKAPTPGPTCDHKMPISPDEVAVYRYTPEGGVHSLIVKHGNWGCAAPGMDAAPFDTVGKETFLNIAEDAKITAVTPIIASPVSKPITLQQLIDWLIAHPNQGRVFRYHLDSAGVIDWMDQQYTAS